MSYFHSFLSSGFPVIAARSAVTKVEVIADLEHGLARRISGHVDGLKTLVVTERAADAGEHAAVAADEGGKWLANNLSLTLRKDVGRS